MDTAFSKEQYESIYPPGIERHWWTMCRIDIIYSLIRKHNLHQSTILEIGCGRGINVKTLTDNNINCYGVELADIQPVEGVHEHVRTGVDARELPEADRCSYECILLLDVIEHIEHPENFIKELMGAFPNVRHLVLTVPACPELWSNYDEFNAHFRRYDLSMLRDLSEQVDATMVEAKYFFHSVYLPARLMKLFRIKRSTRIQAPGTKSFPIHQLLAKLFKLEFKLLPGAIAGTSAIAVLELSRSADALNR